MLGHDDVGKEPEVLGRALSLAEPGRALMWFLMHPVPGLLERHAAASTAHGALIVQILDLLGGQVATAQEARALLGLRARN